MDNCISTARSAAVFCRSMMVASVGNGLETAAIRDLQSQTIVAAAQIVMVSQRRALAKATPSEWKELL